MEYLFIAGISLLVLVMIMSLYGPSPAAEEERAEALEALNLEITRLRKLREAISFARAERTILKRIRRVGTKQLERDEGTGCWVVGWVLLDKDLAYAKISSAEIKQFFGN